MSFAYTPPPALLELIKTRYPLRLIARPERDRTVRIGYGHRLLATFDYPLFDTHARELGRRIDALLAARPYTGPALVIDAPKAEALLTIDLQRTALFVHSVSQRLPAPLPPNPFAAVVAMVYATSHGRYATSAFRRALQAGDLGHAAEYLAAWPDIQALFTTI